MSTVTEQSCARVLDLVAAWMGKRGYGSGPDGTDPAETGEHAAYRGIGPMLNPSWDWPDTPTPTVILEGGPDDWAVECSWDVQQAANAEGLGVFVEPYASYALCIYPA